MVAGATDRTGVAVREISSDTREAVAILRRAGRRTMGLMETEHILGYSREKSVRRE